ncbi:MAG: 6-bladed beta-propeller [Bacteroidia bacterium]|nr:6-bladed beta-propeller [Bacteroidia bacterium]
MQLHKLRAFPCLFILFFILSSANLDTFGQATRPAVPLRIDFEAIVRQDIRLNLSEIVDDIEYIPLETKKECLIGEVDAVRIFKDQIFLISHRQVFKFNKNGQFICKIGSGGQGPGEFVKPIDIQIDEGNNSIFVLDQAIRKIHEYSTDGEYRRSIAIPIPGDPWQILCFENSILIFNQVMPPIETQLYRINQKGEVICRYPVMSELKGSSQFGYSMDYASFMKGPAFFDFTSAWNDTLYRIYKNDHLEPLFIVDFGKFKYPLAGKPEPANQFMKKEFVYQYWRTLTNRNLFFYYGYKDDDRIAVFERSTGKPLFNGSINSKVDRRSYDDLNEGIRNDIDGGRNISTITQFMFTNGKELVRAIDAMDLIESMNTRKSGELNPQYAQKRKAFMELAKGLKEDDNPVIQILHLK